MIQTPNGDESLRFGLHQRRKHTTKLKRNTKMYVNIKDIPAGVTVDNNNYFFDNGELFVYCEK